MKQTQFFVTLILLLPGCGRLVDWSKHHFDQGTSRDLPTRTVRKHVRHARVYDDFSTVGLFDVLWLSDDVRQAYVDAYASKFLKDAASKESFLRRQLAENDHFLSFYVMSYVPDNTLPLGDKGSLWSVLLKVGNKYYEPKNVQSVELNPEYMKFLEPVMTKFKTVYLVKFERKDTEGAAILSSKSRELGIEFRTLDKSTRVAWSVDAQLHLRKKHEGMLV